MLVNFNTESERVATRESTQAGEQSYSNSDAMQIMLSAMLKAMSSLIQLQSKDMQGRSDISKISNDASMKTLESYKTQIEENAKALEEKRTSDDVLKWLGIAATVFSIVLGAVVGGPTGFVIALGLAALLTPGLTSPSKNGDTTLLGKALDDLFLEDASPEVRGIVKMTTILVLCAATGKVGSMGQAATNVAGATTKAGTYWAVQAGVQGLSGLNPTYDLAMIGADKNDKDRKEIAQWVSMGVNLAAGLASMGVAYKTFVNNPQLRSFNVLGSEAQMETFNRTVLNTGAGVEAVKDGFQIDGGFTRLDIANNYEALANTSATMAMQTGMQKLAQGQVSHSAKEYKNTVERENAAVNQYADWTSALYASANAIASNAS
ncbi:MAG: hypothetical protein JSR58_06850 [Verrucomicrobia bacterium]|nr:hypothetical protein [Verrucomicrobiota bacterium]